MIYEPSSLTDEPAIAYHNLATNELCETIYRPLTGKFSAHTIAKDQGEYLGLATSEFVEAEVLAYSPSTNSVSRLAVLEVYSVCRAATTQVE